MSAVTHGWDCPFNHGECYSSECDGKPCKAQQCDAYAIHLHDAAFDLVKDLSQRIEDGARFNPGTLTAIERVIEACRNKPSAALASAPKGENT